MTLHDILHHRRAVRHFLTDKPLDTEAVRQCIALAQLAPTSSNMQLWEAYHVTDKDTLQLLSKACLGQRTATTAQQMVVFVTRPDLYRQHARAVLRFEEENIRRHSPADRHEHRIGRIRSYYAKLMPFLYARSFGLLGAVRKAMAWSIGLFRPMVRQTSEGDMRVVIHKSCALAVQTFMLAMAEGGMDTCPLEGFDSRLVRRALRLPCSAEINMIITCGYRSEKGVWGERFRLPFEEIYHHV